MNQIIVNLKEYLIEKKYIILILGGIIGLLSYLVIYMVQDMNLEAIEDIISAWPEGMIDFFGDVEIFTNPYGFWSLELLSFMWLYAGIYIVYMASGLLSQEIEEKTIELSLSKPITRFKYLGSKISFLYIFIGITLSIFFLITMAGMASSSIFQTEGFYFDRLWLTYLPVILYLGALSMCAFFASTYFLNKSSNLSLRVTTNSPLAKGTLMPTFK